MLIGSFETQSNERLTAIGYCLEQGWTLSGLVMLYAAIDTMSCLYAPAGEEFVTREHFLTWVDDFMVNCEEHLSSRLFKKTEGVRLQIPKLGCTSLELYSARCGLVHTYHAESKLVKRGVRRLYYVVGEVRPEDAIATIRPDLQAGCTVLHAGELFRLFVQAINVFKDAVYNDTDLHARVEERSRLFLLTDEM